MRNLKRLMTVLPMAAAGLYPALGTAEAVNDELRRTLESQQQQINRLEGRLEATATQLERGGASAGDTTVGGYGELHYNNLDSKKELDFHRFVLFFGHRFSDTVRFQSELELEHAVSSSEDVGEVELEQAYVDLRLRPNLDARVGLFLVPVGIINETHEPPSFYGVERNPVERNILPTTWREAGAGLHGELAPGWGYDVAVTSGLNVPTSGGDAYTVREGRQEGAEAVAEDLAYTARLRWTALPGVELAGTVQYQADVTQGAANASATLLETHAVVSRGPFGLRALYATWNLDGSGARAVGRDEQSGWYLEPSYKFSSQAGVFARYNQWDNEAGDTGGSEKKQVNVGLNYWPHEHVVLKLDIQRQSGAVDDDGYNLGFGYQF